MKKLIYVFRNEILTRKQSLPKRDIYYIRTKYLQKSGITRGAILVSTPVEYEQTPLKEQLQLPGKHAS